VLTAELIELDVFVENPTEAISRAGNLLVSIGSCSSSYVEAMIRRETSLSGRGKMAAWMPIWRLPA